jgi:hypothetical protein
LNIPETIKLNAREEVDRHFRETHLANVIKPVDSYTLPATAVAGIQNRGLSSLIRRHYDEQMRFPLKVVNILSGQFARQGLQFFKVNKSVTHVAVARPHYLDLDASPVSEGIRKIVEFINGNPRTTRKKLLEALAPGGSIPPAETAAAPAVEGQPAEAPAPAVASPEAATVVSDLHWLLHQGHVIEFANGILETAKRPVPRPPRPEKKKASAAGAEGVETPAAEHAEGQEGELSGEGTHAEAGAEQQQAAESAEAHAAESTESAETSETHSAEPASEAAPVQDESGASAGADVVTDESKPAAS